MRIGVNYHSVDGCSSEWVPPSSGTPTGSVARNGARSTLGAQRFVVGRDRGDLVLDFASLWEEVADIVPNATPSCKGSVGSVTGLR